MVVRALKAVVVVVAVAGSSVVAGPPAGAHRRAAAAGEGLIGAVPGEILVRFRAGVDRVERAVIRRSAGLRLERRLPVPGLELVRTRPGEVARDAIAGLEARSAIAYAEPNFV